MEIPLGTSKEKKRRFFGKTGSGSSGSSRGQNSWESQPSPTTSQSAISSLNTSFENASISSSGINFPGSGSATPTSGVHSPRSKMSSHLPNNHHRPIVPGNSISLDEAEHMIQHRRFMAAPRRARSAERFDGMRINYSGSSGEKVHYPLTRDELLDRNKFCSPRPTRLPTGSNLVNDPRRNQVPAVASGVATPPPPYQAAVNEKTGPPSYRQALAAAAAAASYAAHSKKAGTAPYHRNAALAHHRGGAQSFDTEFGSSGSMMRSAVSVPAFSNDVICSCSKCQIQNKGMSSDMGYGYGSVGDDAVYMESQAFLMQEIMTDGMAFCSIM